MFAECYFYPGHLSRWFKALSRVEREANIQKRTLPFLAAEDYKHLLIGNILSQKYSSQYAPYNPRYAQWKTQRMLRGSSFWNLYGDLIRNIMVFNHGNGVMAGIPAGVYDRGGKSWFSTRQSHVGRAKPIAMYGQVMEFGLGNHPARPVFLPTAMEYSNLGWWRRGRASQVRIINEWRK